MEDEAISIAVGAASAAEASRLITDLERWLGSRVGENVDLIRVTWDADAQDTGTFLVAIFSAPAVVDVAKEELLRELALKLAKNLAGWQRKRRVTVAIGTCGNLPIHNVDADAVEKIILNALKRQDSRGAD